MSTGISRRGGPIVFALVLVCAVPAMANPVSFAYVGQTGFGMQYDPVHAVFPVFGNVANFTGGAYPYSQVLTPITFSGLTMNYFVAGNNVGGCTGTVAAPPGPLSYFPCNVSVSGPASWLSPTPWTMTVQGTLSQTRFQLTNGQTFLASSPFFSVTIQNTVTGGVNAGAIGVPGAIVPEPWTVMLMGTGLTGLVLLRRRRLI